MKFKKIKFKNYRCFLDGELCFRETGARNINLVIGTNGAGKTELLFAFWWLLYGFNFRQLKNKEATPYALNSSMYKSLQAGSITQASCSVTAELESDGITYVVERTALYRKTGQSISAKESQTVRYYKPNHELSLPYTDEAQVNSILNRILPKSILNGIIFDGERMKQLSSIDETSIKAIAGVINDITNVELVEHCRITFEQLQRSVNKRTKALAKQHGNVSLSELVGEIDTLQERIAQDKQKKDDLIETIATLKMQIQELLAQLEEIKEARSLEQERKKARDDLQKEETRKRTIIHNFTVSLSNSYLLGCGPLFSSVEDLLLEYDVPADLTVSAVDNILLRPRCICGNAWTSHMREEVCELRRKLPPDNINSAMGEKVHQMRIQSQDKRRALKVDFDALTEVNETINGLKARIASLSAQISHSGSEAAEDIERRYNSLYQNLIDCTAEHKIISDRLPGLERELESRLKVKSALSDNAEESAKLDKEAAFIRKCLLALEQIVKTNRMSALQQINTRLQEAYQLMSQDFSLGRRLYIVQFDDVARYQLVSYYEDKLQDELRAMTNSGREASLKAAGLTDAEILEVAIMNCAQSNSTGQSKINTLAFVRAILDYANDPHQEDLFEVTKEYPLLIDAPFGDIFDQNLERSAASLHTFTHQIILMLAKESYAAVAQFINPFVGTVHKFERVANEDRSSIITTTMEEI